MVTSRDPTSHRCNRGDYRNVFALRRIRVSLPAGAAVAVVGSSRRSIDGSCDRVFWGGVLFDDGRRKA